MSTLATVAITEREGVVIARVRGEIDMSNAEALERKMGEAVPNTAVGMVVDLSDVTYLDSAGIRLVIALGQRLRLRRQRVALVVTAQGPIRRVLELTDIARLVPVSPGVDEAVSRVAGDREL
ncbi:MAG: STAS domain-containing protein [Actinomycetota bacterium]